MEGPIIELEGISKAFGDKKVLEGIDLAIERGEIFTIIGPSGSGKTTLIRLIDLLDTPTSGQVLFEGEDANTSERRRLDVRRRMAMVFQKPIVLSRTVAENVSIGLKFRGMPTDGTKEKVATALAHVGLDGFEHRRAVTLSGGEMQRVALARALVIEPEALLLAEPTANLDPLSTETIEQLVKRINKDAGITVIIATHDLVQGQQLANRIGVIMDGMLAQVGRPADIFHRPACTSLARFVGMENSFPGTVRDAGRGISTIDVRGIAIAAAAQFPRGTPVVAFVRPEDVAVATSAPDGSSVRNVLSGTIREIVPMGPVVRVHVDTGIDIAATLTIVSAEELALAPGMPVIASFKASAVHVIEQSTQDVCPHPPR